MKRFYTLLFGITLLSSHSVAKTGKIDAKYQTNKKNKSEYKSAKLKSSKLVPYKVNSGDTLYTIAKKHKTTILKVTMVNDLEKDEKLKIGRELKIPAFTNSIDAKKSELMLASVIHEIEENKKKEMALEAAAAERISKKEAIAKTASVQEVSKKEKTVKVASAKKVSKKEKSSSKNKVDKKKSNKKIASYKVKKGDSLYAIAKKNHITVDELTKVNKVKSDKYLKYGQILTIPTSSKEVKTKIAKAKVKPKKKIAKTKVKSKKKIAKAKVKTKTKIAKTTKKKTKKIASAKKHSKQKLIIDGSTGKTTFQSLFSSNRASTLKLSSAKKQLGKRYVWGATGPRAFDCSGFTSYVCKKNGVAIPRTSIKQSKVGKRVNRRALKAGDLVFFDTSKRRRGYINHVGIYIGNNKFIHASSAKKRVVITSLEKPFYKSRFKWGSRVKG